MTAKKIKVYTLTYDDGSKVYDISGVFDSLKEIDKYVKKNYPDYVIDEDSDYTLTTEVGVFTKIENLIIQEFELILNDTKKR